MFCSLDTVLPSHIRYIYNEIPKCEVYMNTHTHRKRESVCVCVVLTNHRTVST